MKSNIEKCFSATHSLISMKKGIIYLKKLILLVCLFLYLGMLSGCYDPQDVLNQSQNNLSTEDSLEKAKFNSNQPYLSIAITYYDNGSNPQGGMTTQFYCLDINSKKTTKIEGIPYTSQYPLGVYSRSENKLYYSAQVQSENKKTGDELFSYDLNTGKKQQLSAGLFAINYIVPMKESVAIVAVMRKERELKLGFYNNISNNVEFIDIDNDLGAQILSYNPFIDKLAVAYRYGNEEYAAADDFNTQKTNKFVPPNYHVYCFDGKVKTPKKIFSTQNMLIDWMALDNNGNLLYCESDTLQELKPISHSYLLNLQKNKKELIENIGDNMWITEHVFYNNDKNEVFFLGVKNGLRGIYLYDFDTQKIELIFKDPKGTGFINNFMLLTY